MSLTPELDDILPELYVVCEHISQHGVPCLNTVWDEAFSYCQDHRPWHTVTKCVHFSCSARTPAGEFMCPRHGGRHSE